MSNLHPMSEKPTNLPPSSYMIKSCSTCKTIYYDNGEAASMEGPAEQGIGLVCTGVPNTPTPLMGETVENCKIWQDRRSGEERREGEEREYNLRSANCGEKFVQHPDHVDLIRDYRSGEDRREA